jgi:hypothetical protein
MQRLASRQPTLKEGYQTVKCKAVNLTDNLSAATENISHAMPGAALPSTATEQRYLGKTSADLTDKIKQQAREGFEAVRDSVTKTTDHSGTEIRPDGERRPASDSPADLSRGLGTS